MSHLAITTFYRLRPQAVKGRTRETAKMEPTTGSPAPVASGRSRGLFDSPLVEEGTVLSHNVSDVWNVSGDHGGAHLLEFLFFSL